MTFYDCDDYDHLWFVVWYGFIRRSQKDVLGNYLLDLFRDPIFQPLLQQYTMWIYVAPKIGPPQKIQGSQWDPWEFQDPKLEVLYHIRPYVVGIFHFRILEWPLTISDTYPPVDLETPPCAGRVSPLGSGFLEHGIGGLLCIYRG